jgi:excisionase family DNA binding protein
MLLTGKGGIKMETKFLTIKDISEILSVHPNTVRNWIRSGELKSYKFEKAVRVTEEDFEEFLEANKKQTQEE